MFNTMAYTLRMLHPTATGIRSRFIGGNAASAVTLADAVSGGSVACARNKSIKVGSDLRSRFSAAFDCRGGLAAGTALSACSFTRARLTLRASAVDLQNPQRCNYACRPQERRSFSSTISNAAKELVKTINNEIQHEQSTYEADGDLKRFLQTSGWELTEQENDMMVTLKKEVAGKKVLVEFSCVQNAEAPAGEEGPAAEMSDFTITITKAGKDDGEGITFYCSTTQDEEEKFRYCVGQVRLFKTTEEKESLSVYPGPYFEDLDDAFQQCLDEWLSKMGIDNDLCDFIDKFSVDKESREYLAWLKKLANFVTE